MSGGNPGEITQFANEKAWTNTVKSICSMADRNGKILIRNTSDIIDRVIKKHKRLAGNCAEGKKELSGEKMSKMTDEFRNKLCDMFEYAEQTGKSHLPIVAKELHDAVGASQSFPQCCNVMWEAIREGDKVMYTPPKGRGSALRIEYKIPRGAMPYSGCRPHRDRSESTCTRCVTAYSGCVPERSQVYNELNRIPRHSKLQGQVRVENSGKPAGNTTDSAGEYLLKTGSDIYRFTRCLTTMVKKDLCNTFAGYDRKTLWETVNTQKYVSLKSIVEHKYMQYGTAPLGGFLLQMKKNGDDFYRQFLNAYGDNKFCEFRLEHKQTNDAKGLYCYCIGDVLLYIGRFVRGFVSRINNGYGKIHPKNCYRDGQSTNCHLNSLINASPLEVQLYVCPLDGDNTFVGERERLLINMYNPRWNIALKRMTTEENGYE